MNKPGVRRVPKGSFVSDVGMNDRYRCTKLTNSVKFIEKDPPPVNSVKLWAIMRNMLHKMSTKNFFHRIRFDWPRRLKQVMNNIGVSFASNINSSKSWLFSLAASKI